MVKEALNRFSMKMTTDRQKRHRNGMIRVRKSRRCTGGFGEDVSAELSISTFAIFLLCSLRIITLSCVLLSRVEFLSSLNI